MHRRRRPDQRLHAPESSRSHSGALERRRWAAAPGARSRAAASTGHRTFTAAPEAPRAAPLALAMERSRSGAHRKRYAAMTAETCGDRGDGAAGPRPGTAAAPQRRGQPPTARKSDGCSAANSGAGVQLARSLGRRLALCRSPRPPTPESEVLFPRRNGRKGARSAKRLVKTRVHGNLALVQTRLARSPKHRENSPKESCWLRKMACRARS